MARSRLLMERGETLTRTVIWTDSESEAIDLTGYTISCNVTVGEVSYDLTEGVGLEVTEASGEIAITLEAAETDAFEEHFGKWQLRTESYTGDVTFLAEGMVYVSFYE